MLKVLIVTLLF